MVSLAAGICFTYVNSCSGGLTVVYMYMLSAGGSLGDYMNDNHLFFLEIWRTGTPHGDVSAEVCILLFIIAQSIYLGMHVNTNLGRAHVM